MPLLTLRGVALGFGGDPVLDGVDLQIEAGERLCLVGRNGEGKSTLLKVLSGDLVPEDGIIERQQGLRVATLTQALPEGQTGSVAEVVAEGLGAEGVLLARYQQLSARLGEGETGSLAELAQAQQALEAAGGWSLQPRVETVLSRLALPGAADFAALSGGMKRRVLLARALVGEPDLLLLDEPTNHLDIDAILWLEAFLLGFKQTLVLITHDRMLAGRLATRIIELDRGRLTSWPGDYQTYLQRKAEALAAEAREWALFDKKLAEEERWIRQGIEARRTRNEGRVRALLEMRSRRQARRTHGGKVRLHLNEAERSGRLVVEAEAVGFAYDDRPVIRDFSTLILRGDRVGIIGPNGAGKTTLLRLLLGKLQPQQGRIRLGTKLDIAYFDQHRAQLDVDKTVIENVSPGSDHVVVNGLDRHVVGYLQDFLFAPARARTPVRALSGGERNRLLLARLFARPANLLVMDEPTNDLDIETLELLEERLLEFPGTLLLVSHDRAFINQVVTSTLVFEGDGRIGEYVGGYDDWLRQRPAATVKTPVSPTGAAPRSRPAARTKLSYKEQRELEQLPLRIEALEAEQRGLVEAMAAADYYRRDGATIAADQARLAEIERTLAEAYGRWEALEAVVAQGGD